MKAFLKLPSGFNPTFGPTTGVRSFVFALGKVSLIAAVWFAHEMGNNIRLAEHQKLPQINLNLSEDPGANKAKSTLNSYSVIAQRNLFGVSKSESNSAKQKETVSSLSLRLVGTNVNSSGSSFAIIEDTKSKNQDVFDINDSIFDQAKLVVVMAESVKIERNGKEEVLLLQDSDVSSSPNNEGSSPTEDRTDYSITEGELSAELANLPKLLSQARAVPYFRNGKSIGMRLFAIRSGSIYEKLGLKNGDIIKSVNNNSLSDPTQALRLFEQLKNERSIGVATERGGQDLQLNYNIR